MTNQLKDIRVKNVQIIIKKIGLAGLTDIEDQAIKLYLEGKKGYCEEVVDFLLFKINDKNN